MRRCELWWADLPMPTGSGPGYRRPVLLIQADSFIDSRIKTIIVAIITKNLALAKAPGNVFLPTDVSRLPLDSVINTSQIITIDKNLLTEYIHTLPASTMATVESGLRLVLGF